MRARSGGEEACGKFCFPSEASKRQDFVVTEPRQMPETDRREASRRAVEMRRARAALKRDLTAGVISPQQLLRQAFTNPASPAGTLRVPALLTSLRSIGPTKRDNILEQLQISPVKRAGGLGPRQRVALMNFLNDHFPEPPHSPTR